MSLPFPFTTGKSTVWIYRFIFYCVDYNLYQHYFMFECSHIWQWELIQDRSYALLMFLHRSLSTTLHSGITFQVYLGPRRLLWEDGPPILCVVECLAASLASAPQIVTPFPLVTATKTVSRHWHVSLGERGKKAPGEDHCIQCLIAVINWLTNNLYFSKLKHSILITHGKTKGQIIFVTFSSYPGAQREPS